MAIVLLRNKTEIKKAIVTTTISANNKGSMSPDDHIRQEIVYLLQRMFDAVFMMMRMYKCFLAESFNKQDVGKVQIYDLTPFGNDQSISC